MLLKWHALAVLLAFSGLVGCNEGARTEPHCGPPSGEVCCSAGLAVDATHPGCPFRGCPDGSEQTSAAACTVESLEDGGASDGGF